MLNAVIKMKLNYLSLKMFNGYLYKIKKYNDTSTYIVKQLK